MTKTADTFLLDCCEKFGHELQIRHDRDIFWLTNLVYHILPPVVGMIYGCAVLLVSPPEPGLVLVSTFLALILSTCAYLVLPTQLLVQRKTQAAAYNAMSKGCKNPFAAAIDWRLRQVQYELLFAVVFALLGLVQPWMFAGAVYFLGDLFCLYGISTTPLHPNEVARHRTERHAPELATSTSTA